ncbi:MAG: CoA pyrophosphatase [Myxococcota bacterium]
MTRPLLLDNFSRVLGARSRRTLEPGRRDAAVLVPLLRKEDALHVLFTLRTEDVPTHKGQVAFPGGVREEDDADLIFTALREAHEEIGLHPSSVDVLGMGDDAISITGLRVTPVVGWVPALPSLVLSPREIAEVFTVPLEVLRRPGAVTEQTLKAGDGTKRRVPFFEGGPHPIWGLTAWILRELLNVMDEHDLQ